jgi:flagellar assembly protein FliH
MSSRARRLVAPANAVRFSWARGQADPTAGSAESAPASERGTAVNTAAIERDAFAKGFAAGERAGLEAAGQRGEAMLTRLTETLEQLTTLRNTMIHRTERQMVQLALAIAHRIVQREVSLDRDLVVAMARVALDRLGETARVTVRMNPDDFAVTAQARAAQLAGSNVSVVADARIGRGGCRVESDLGVMDAGVEEQLREVARALLGDMAQAEEESVGVIS